MAAHVGTQCRRARRPRTSPAISVLKDGLQRRAASEEAQVTNHLRRDGGGAERRLKAEDVQIGAKFVDIVTVSS